jgi:hypothetical protein
VTVSAMASDDSAVVGVQFALDGTPLGAEDTAAPYELTWPTTSVENGAHILTAVARDAAGHETVTSVSVTVINDTMAPTVALTNPTAAETVAGLVTLAATATDDVAVAGVQFTVDGTPLGVEDTTAPYEFAWPTTSAVNGLRTVTAIARDAAGHETTASVDVTVSNDPTP